MSKFTGYILCIVMAAAMIAPPCASAAGWEPVKTEQSATAKSVMKHTEFEVKATSGAIMVTANHPVQIKVFTILGRVVSSETLPQGTMRLQLPAHGVYIVKIGDLTCKVAV